MSNSLLQIWEEYLCCIMIMPSKGANFVYSELLFVNYVISKFLPPNDRLVYSCYLFADNVLIVCRESLYQSSLGIKGFLSNSENHEHLKDTPKLFILL